MLFDRCALFYPLSDIPPARVRYGVLYWDTVGSIVFPNESDQEWVFPHMQLLEDYGLYRRFDPVTYSGDPDVIKNVANELDEILGSSHFLESLRFAGGYASGLRCRPSKSDPVYAVLAKHGAAVGLYQKDELRRQKRADGSYYSYIENYFGLKLLVDGNYDKQNYTCQIDSHHLYLALEAKHLATSLGDKVTPITHDDVLSRLLFRETTADAGVSCLSVSLQDLIPVPDESVPLERILKFRQQRRNELLAFRVILDEFQATLANCESPDEIGSALLRCREKLEKGVGDLEAMMRDARIATLVGSLETLIKPTSPAFWGTALAAAGYTAKAAELSPYLAAIGIGMASLVQVGKYVLDRRNERAQQLRNSAFAYVYRARNELK